MSDGMSDANAMGRLGARLETSLWELREAIKAAEAGHRGMSIDVQDAANEILLPGGWKLVRAQEVKVYR